MGERRITVLFRRRMQALQPAMYMGRDMAGGAIGTGMTRRVRTGARPSCRSALNDARERAGQYRIAHRNLDAQAFPDRFVPCRFLPASQSASLPATVSRIPGAPAQRIHWANSSPDTGAAASQIPLFTHVRHGTPKHRSTRFQALDNSINREQYGRPRPLGSEATPCDPKTPSPFPSAPHPIPDHGRNSIPMSEPPTARSATTPSAPSGPISSSSPPGVVIEDSMRCLPAPALSPRSSTPWPRVRGHPRPCAATWRASRSRTRRWVMARR